MQSQGLTERTKLFIETAQKHPKAKKLVDSIRWTQIIKFIVDDNMEFYLDVKRGDIKVVPGDFTQKDRENEFYDVSRVYIDGETLIELLEGRKDSVDAQYRDEALKVLPGGKYYVVTLVHQLFRFGRQELLEKKNLHG